MAGVDRRRRIGQASVEQFLAAEGSGVGDAVDARKNRIDLQLVGVNFFAG